MHRKFLSAAILGGLCVTGAAFANDKVALTGQQFVHKGRGYQRHRRWQCGGGAGIAQSYGALG